MTKKSSLHIPVSHIDHKEKRTNIPTEELRNFVADDEKQPKSMLYPRDPSLDPQLVWKGKDEQDSHPLEVPVVPIYIQEEIAPQAIIENVRASAKKQEKESTFQPEIFSDFNGIKFEDMVDFYHHEQNWTNRMILGDSLLVMSSLAEKEGLKGKVQMIYLDPPYGIKFGSNWQTSTRKREVKDTKGDDVTRQPEQIKAFRDTWELGIHSYLPYLRDRFISARELLNESGSIFIQIGDENVHLVRSVLDEIFGSENFISLITFKKTLPLGASGLPAITDYLLWYGKDKDQNKFNPIFIMKGVGEGTGYTWVELPSGIRRKLTTEEKENIEELPKDWNLFFSSAFASSGYTPTCTYDFAFEGKIYKALNKSWRTNKEGLERLLKSDRIIAPGNLPNFIAYHKDFPVQPLHNLWDDTHGAVEMQYVVETSKKVIERCMLMTTDPGDIVLDPTCGSGTTAFVAEQWGRRWITIDTSRVALALARTRLMAAKYPYYLLKDSPDGSKREMEVSGIFTVGDNEELSLGAIHDEKEKRYQGDVRKGFVYKRVPHITLKSIANNEEIDEIYKRWTKEMDPIRVELNKTLRKAWEEWDVPRELEQTGNAKNMIHLFTKWWEFKRLRKNEINASISKYADIELLFDNPYEDSKRIRVTGPFTVESLSPHRVLSTDEGSKLLPLSEKRDASDTFTPMIIENLKTAGVQNTIKKERIKFERLEPFAGVNIQAVGEYSDSDKKVKRVAVCIGPEHGTVGPDLVKEAAKEAVKGVGYDLLIVCGFSFDPHVSEETKQFGKLTVLAARMNPDLAMGDTLLKKTGAGNLFMVFGEPDIEITKKDNKLVVKLKGLDIYDPTTGEVRSCSPDEIACWFIDTDYNGESFFVRHAYFTGANDPYEKLKRALRAEIDEAAWSALYSTTSYPFEKPEGGKIAVKVINHYGDEVMKVFEV
jgi:adenine-specific DNA-methyltransferase